MITYRRKIITNNDQQSYNSILVDQEIKQKLLKCLKYLLDLNLDDNQYISNKQKQLDLLENKIDSQIQQLKHVDKVDKMRQNLEKSLEQYQQLKQDKQSIKTYHILQMYELVIEKLNKKILQIFMNIFVRQMQQRDLELLQNNFDQMVKLEMKIPIAFKLIYGKIEQSQSVNFEMNKQAISIPQEIQINYQDEKDETLMQEYLTNVKYYMDNFKQTQDLEVQINSLFLFFQKQLQIIANNYQNERNTFLKKSQKEQIKFVQNLNQRIKSIAFYVKACRIYEIIKDEKNNSLSFKNLINGCYKLNKHIFKYRFYDFLKSMQKDYFIDSELDKKFQLDFQKYIKNDYSNQNEVQKFELNLEIYQKYQISNQDIQNGLTIGESFQNFTKFIRFQLYPFLKIDTYDNNNKHVIHLICMAVNQFFKELIKIIFQNKMQFSYHGLVRLLISCNCIITSIIQPIKNTQDTDFKVDCSIPFNFMNFKTDMPQDNSKQIDFFKDNSILSKSEQQYLFKKIYNLRYPWVLKSIANAMLQKIDKQQLQFRQKTIDFFQSFIYKDFQDYKIQAQNIFLSVEKLNQYLPIYTMYQQLNDEKTAQQFNQQKK